MCALHEVVAASHAACPANEVGTSVLEVDVRRLGVGGDVVPLLMFVGEPFWVLVIESLA